MCYLCIPFFKANQVKIMTEIVYMTQGNVEMPRLNETAVRDWIIEVASRHGQKVGCLTYVFCDDAYILATNREFLGHDYYTDIITFDYTNSRHIAGDMVISLDTVLTNSQGLNTPYETELMRVIIHGVLHLCGINDKGPGEREIMEQHENDALAILPADVYLKD
jgi:rRNA maturation RNase YbeY